jgi:hypothetical protein
MLDKNWTITLLIHPPLIEHMQNFHQAPPPESEVKEFRWKGLIFKENLWKFHRVGIKVTKTYGISMDGEQWKRNSTG